MRGGHHAASIRVLLDSMEHLPAVVFNSRLDVLAANDLGRALYAPMLDTDGPVNSARFVFLEEHAARRLFPEWERIANDTVSILRIESGRPRRPGAGRPHRSAVHPQPGVPHPLGRP
jgi:hypothetical protein